MQHNAMTGSVVSEASSRNVAGIDLRSPDAVTAVRFVPAVISPALAIGVPLIAHNYFVSVGSRMAPGNEH